MERDVFAILGSSMHVVKELRNFMLELCAQIVVVRNFGKLEPMRPLGRSGNCQHEDVVVRIVSADQQRGRAAEMGQGYSAKAETLAHRGGWQIYAAKEIARLQHVAMVAGYEILDTDARLAAIGRNHSADTFKRDCKRDHRARWQRHADIPAHGGGVPDFERGEERAA